MAPPTGFSPFRASSHLPSTCTPGHRPCLHIASIPNPSPKPPWFTRSFPRYALRLVTPLPRLMRSLLPFLWARWAQLCGRGCYPHFFPQCSRCPVAPPKATLMVPAYPTPSRRTGCLDQLSRWQLPSLPLFSALPFHDQALRGEGSFLLSSPLW